jgi:hypothetical protein
MKTEVIMKRKLFNMEIAQKSKSEFLSATDLTKAGNQWRLYNGLAPFSLSEWFRQKGTIDFMAELENKFKCKVKIAGRGRGKHTWVHPYLFIDLALAISPKLKIETYSWLYDYLLRYRNESGDSYTKMSGALYAKFSNKKAFGKYIAEVAKQIKFACGVSKWEDWQKADTSVLAKRDKIQENIALLADILPVDEAVRIGILKAEHN